MARSDPKPTAVADIKAQVLSASLLAAVEVGLFARLRRAPAPVEDLLSELGLERSVGSAWLQVLRAGGYLACRSGLLALTERARPLAADGPVISWAKEMALFGRALTDLPSLLRGGAATSSALGDFWAYKRAGAAVGEGAAAAYSATMDESQERHAHAVLGLWDFGGYRRIADLGGGYGGFARRLVERYPGLDVVVVDLPAVVATAPAGPAGVRFLAADLFTDELEEGFDCAIFNRVLHDWSDPEAVTLLAKARSLVVSGGEVIVAEKLAPEADLDLDQAATALMLVLLGGARRSAARYSELMAEAGLVVEAVIGTSEGPAAVVVGRPAERGRD
jgi:SAM-dependent methyltransferase